jgi:DNA-binding MarR family transcriptional regulator/CheY-like chemotaxis protein
MTAVSEQRLNMGVGAMSSSAQTALNYSDAPAILLFGDSAAGLAAASVAAEAAGGRVAAALPIEQALVRLEEQAALAAVMLDIGEDHGDLLDRLLDRLDDAARMGRHPSIVAMSPDLIDIVTARAAHRDIALLCAPDPLERVAALGLALSGRMDRLNDIGSEPGAVRLQQLSEEVGRIARTLAMLSGREPPERIDGFTLADRRTTYAAPAGGEAASIRAIIRGRRLRDQYFDSALFADPAWDILLDLTAAQIEKRPVAVSSLCIAAAVPPTTALRWITRLTEEGLLTRVADPRDGRRVFIALSDHAAEGMFAYLAAAKRAGAIPG